MRQGTSSWTFPEETLGIGLGLVDLRALETNLTLLNDVPHKLLFQGVHKDLFSSSSLTNSHKILNFNKAENNGGRKADFDGIVSFALSDRCVLSGVLWDIDAPGLTEPAGVVHVLIVVQDLLGVAGDARKLIHLTTKPSLCRVFSFTMA